jgi:RNase P/RNase MRP subunit POP5
MKKIKPIMPSLKEKKRYIAYEVISESEAKPGTQAVEKAITDSLLEFVGELGTAQAGILFPKPGIIKVSHTSTEQAKAAIALVKQINGKQVALRTLGASGMLNKAEKYLN